MSNFNENFDNDFQVERDVNDILCFDVNDIRMFATKITILLLFEPKYF